MKVSELLTVAKLLPRTTRAHARDATGEQVGSCSDKAVSFCASGALSRACDNDFNKRIAAAKLLRIASLQLARTESFIQINDRQPELMDSVWDRAIQLAIEEEQ